MEVVQHQDIGDAQWDAFCDASPGAWIRHRSDGRRAALALDESSEDRSFGMKEGATLVAIAPLIIEPLIATKGREFAFSVNTRPSDTHSLPNPSPALADALSPSEQAAIYAACMKEIDRLALTLGIARSRMFIDPLTDAAFATNPFLQFGYADTSTVTYIMDLRHDEDTLRSRVSKGNRSDITFAEKQGYKTDFFDSDTITEEAWTAFTDLYALAAGRPIGSPERTRELLGRVRSGHALLALLRQEHAGGYLSGALVTIYKRCASYGMAATDPQYRNLRGIGQFIQWRIMQELKRRGFERYDMGWQTGSTEKEAAIADFKRHLGGDPVPLWIGVKDF